MTLKNFALFTESLGSAAGLVLSVNGRECDDIFSLDTYHDDGRLAWQNMWEYESDDEDEEEFDDDNFDEAKYFADCIKWGNDYLAYNADEVFQELGLGIKSVRLKEHLPYNGAFYPSVILDFEMEADWLDQAHEVTDVIHPKKFAYFLSQELTDTEYSNLDAVALAMRQSNGTGWGSDSHRQGTALAIIASFLIGKRQLDDWKNEMNQTIAEEFSSNHSKWDYEKQ